MAVGVWERRDLERVKFSGERAQVSFVQLNVEIEQEDGVERSVLVQGYSARRLLNGDSHPNLSDSKDCTLNYFRYRWISS